MSLSKNVQGKELTPTIKTDRSEENKRCLPKRKKKKNWVAMSKKILKIILGGLADRNIRFQDLRNLLRDLGFSERIKGDHHIFYKEGVDEIINLHPLSEGKAKA